MASQLWRTVGAVVFVGMCDWTAVAIPEEEQGGIAGVDMEPLRMHWGDRTKKLRGEASSCV